MRSDEHVTLELSAVGGQHRVRDVVRDSPPQRERLVRDVLLRDGSTLRLQAPTPADFEDIKGFYDGLSQESRYFRFHGSCRTDVVARGEARRRALIGSR